MLKVSIITVCYNSADTIESTIQSVLSQDYPNIEYIIVDGKSTDSNTCLLSININLKLHTCISEKDNGIYDALNKGIALATGDIIAILHADDFYTSTVISDIVPTFETNRVRLCIWRFTICGSFKYICY